MDPARSHAAFQTTEWSLLGALRRGDDAAAEVLVQRYWPPVYAYLRRKSVGREKAEELTQAFFATVVVGRRLFQGADPHRGRLRSLLLVALGNFVRDEHRRETVRGKGLEIPPEAVTCEEEWVRRSPAEPPDRAFDRRWAAELVAEALRRSEQHFLRTGRAGHWKVFELRIVAPNVRGLVPQALAELAEDAGFAGPAAAAAAVQVVKDRTRALLHQVVAETVDDPAQLEAELLELKQVLGA